MIDKSRIIDNTRDLIIFEKMTVTPISDLHFKLNENQRSVWDVSFSSNQYQTNIEQSSYLNIDHISKNNKQVIDDENTETKHRYDTYFERTNQILSRSKFNLS